MLLKNNHSPKAVSKLMGHVKEIITLDVYGDNSQLIEDGVAELQPFIEDVLPPDEEKFKDLSTIVLDLDILLSEEQSCASA